MDSSLNFSNSLPNYSLAISGDNNGNEPLINKGTITGDWLLDGNHKTNTTREDPRTDGYGLHRQWGFIPISFPPPMSSGDAQLLDNKDMKQWVQAAF